MRILIVDDDPIALEILRHAVEKAGHQVTDAPDGEAALEILKTDPHRMVISDWEMPGLDGLELCTAIRMMDFAGYVYVIMLTGHDSVEERIAGLSAGADDFISKPFSPAELVVHIRTAERILSLETRDVAIFAMAKLAESRDSDTGAHIERVQSFARLLAQTMASFAETSEAIDSEFIRLVFATSPLHDIGKVGIPDQILLKPGKLTPEEFAIMKTHSTIGAQTLEAALSKFPGTRFLEMARDIAGCHHEKYDGSGYPTGLVGNKIPLAARIVALADVYDALTTKRCYKKAFTHEDARELILKEKGRHFDPDVVEAFLRSEAQFILIRKQLDDEVNVQTPAAEAAKQPLAA